MSNASEITAKLWAMANKLRGTMDASEYKIIFYHLCSTATYQKIKTSI